MYQNILKKYHLIEMSTTIIKKDQHEMKTIGLINLKRWYNYEANDIVATRLIIMRNSKFLISSKKHSTRDFVCACNHEVIIFYGEKCIGKGN